VDVDGDGYQDLLSGSWPGEIFLFQGSSVGVSSTGDALKHKDGRTVNVGRASAAFAADWDSDGDLDLLVGNIQGAVFLVPNEGGPKKLEFGEPVALRAGAQTIAVPAGDAGPCAADWDQDGDLDLLVGAGDGSVWLFENTGTSDLAAGRQLLKPGTMAIQEPNRPATRGGRSKICVVDWNGDGRLDLLVGDVAKMRRPSARELSAEEKEVLRRDLARARLRWHALVKRKASADSRAGHGESGQQSLEVLDRELMEARRELLELEMRVKMPGMVEVVGWVWVFLRRSADQKVSRAESP
jgi:hypothetical protein